ncbi:O(6)-methylguanine-induced apoptosis 2 isoform X2 [Hyla sarda]|uniref:O(6)-methylguanine-induced apoptosis 2 isoform X2 n=1 Tax=Hyla sarda TaxID=327740 RepID=UPI0024C26378|nr:O(6)-methylguanine-induced apoptosis 2 isoform X2 [Hyla sarda]
MPTPSSIPTKYQTVYIPESEKKGFNSRSLRFSYSLKQNENPGPGSYNVGKGPNTYSVSHSSKGTGGFPSKVPRTSRNRAVRSPAPNSYNIQGSVFSKKDFSKSYSSMFHQPIAVKVENTKHKMPAPNQYNVSINFCHPNNNVSAHAAFVSGTKRDAIQMNTLKGPSPCHYTINDSQVKESPKVVASCFKSNTSRDILNVTSNFPGPTSYDPYGSPEIRKKPVFTKKHFLCFSAPAVPVPKTPPVPGPGHYDLVDFEGPPKHYISSAVFVSNTSRWAGDVFAADVPGPGAYRPEVPGKQSFLYNCDKKWIPA